MTRKNILVLAYSISPVRGSEFSVGWNYVEEMSKGHNLIVLYGAAGEHLGNFEELEIEFVSESLRSVDFVPVVPSRITTSLNWLNSQGILKYSFYLAYRSWHKQAYRKALEIVANKDIDVVHYVCPIGYREPGFLWKIDKPYIWGPVGGLKNRPAHLMWEKNKILGLFTYARNFVNTLQRNYSGRVRKAFARADVVLAATSENAKIIEQNYGRKPIYLPENGITAKMLEGQKFVEFKQGEPTRLIWVGSLDNRKSIDILLKALAKVRTRFFCLFVLGDGPLRDEMKNLALELGLEDNVVWVGRLSRDECNDFYSVAHLHVLTSLDEGNATVIWEAMSFGLPTVAFDHCGMRDVICDSCGVKVQLGGLDTMIRSLSSELDILLNDRDRIRHLSSGVIKCSNRYAWSERVDVWDEIYNSAIASWHQKHSVRES
jgi:glycosyltransferase involved in cell wall biosynthesis